MLPVVIVVVAVAAVDTGAAQTLPRSDRDSVQHVSRSWLLLAGKAKPKAEVSFYGKSAIFTVIPTTNPIAIPIPIAIDCHSSWALMLMKPTAGGSAANCAVNTHPHTHIQWHTLTCWPGVNYTTKSSVCLCGPSSGDGTAAGAAAGAGRTESRSCERVSSVAPKCFCIRSVFVLATILSMMVLNYVWVARGKRLPLWALWGAGHLRVV